MKKRILSALMALLLTATLPASAFAEEYDLANGSIEVSADSTGQYVTQTDYGITNQAQTSETVITQTGSTPTTNIVTIDAAGGAEAKVTLDGVNIDVSGTGSLSCSEPGIAAVSVTGSGNANIELDGNNTVRSGIYHAGLEKSSTGELTITDTGNNGSLVVTGGFCGAGIGGGINGKGSNITITDGKVTAQGGAYAAGIGGGSSGDGTDITITDGEVTAKGGMAAVGIGGGISGDGTDITITGGEVTATGDDAGIGGGFNGSGSNIAITGGEVTATGGECSAGIGGGTNGNGSNITIEGGGVKATGGAGAAGIGGGFTGSGSNIKVSDDAQLKVQGGEKNDSINGGAAIGNGGSHESSGYAEEVAPNTNGLTENGYILYYDPDADMDTDQPTGVIHYGNTVKHTSVTVTPKAEPTCTDAGSTIGLDCDCDFGLHIEPQTIKATGHTWGNGKCSVCGVAQPASAMAQSDEILSSPLYRVTDKAGKDIAYNAEQNDGTLTITVDADFAVLTGTLSGISALKAQSVEKIVFVTNGASSTFALADLLAKGSMGNTYKLAHDGATVTFILGATGADVSDILG